jgi:hypothetical protein
MRLHASTLVLVVLSTGCTTGTAPVLGVDGGADLCEGQNCSGHGSCAVVDRTSIACICDTGFAAQGTTCSPVTAGAECHGVDCGGNGSCIVARGQPDYPVCQCRAGFKQVGNTTCFPETNPCEGITCGGQGTCAVRGTEGVCVCNAGFVLMGTTQCIPVAGSPCVNVSCSGNGQCEVADGMARCQCNPGFVANGTACEPAPQSPCTGVTCSGQGVCSVTSAGQAVCTCNPGYTAMGTSCVAVPADGGLPTCAGITCSGNGTCSIDVNQNSMPTCVCNPGFRPGPNNTCVQGCGSGCAAGEYCQFSSDMCRPLPARGAQWGIPQTQSQLNDIAVAPSGEYYVVGERTDTPGSTSVTQKQAVLVKYSPQHSVLWERVWGQPTLNDVARAVSIDSAGNIWTIGTSDYTVNSSTQVSTGKGELVRWGPDGTRQWTFKYDLPGRSTSGEPKAFAVGPGPAFNVVVGGDVERTTFMGQGNAAGSRDGFVMQISTAGAGSIVWTRVFGAPTAQDFDTLTAVALDGNGDLYATGSATGNVNGATNFSGGGQCLPGGFYGNLVCMFQSCTCTDGFITKWNSAGTVQWSIMMGVAGQTDRGQDVVVTPDGVFVAGSTRRNAATSFSGISIPERFAGFVTRLDTMTGAVVWRREVDATGGPLSSYSLEFVGIAADPAGSIHTTGHTPGTYEGLMGKGQIDVVSTRWAIDGSKVSSRVWGSDDPMGNELAARIAVGGVPARVHIVGNSSSNPGAAIKDFTAQGTNASFILVE